jgi:hypothetical protein
MKNYTFKKAIYFTWVFLIFFFNASTLAEPEPLGIKIKETDINYIKSKYTFTNKGINAYSKGQMLDLEPGQFQLQGLKDVRLIFGEDNKVLAVLTVIKKDRFDDLLNMLSSKYYLISKEVPFVGNKNASFKDDNTKITLSAPHLSFDLNLDYIHNDLRKAFIEQSEEEKQKKAQEEMNKI